MFSCVVDSGRLASNNIFTILVYERGVKVKIMSSQNDSFVPVVPTVRGIFIAFAAPAELAHIIRDREHCVIEARAFSDGCTPVMQGRYLG